jgi:hypothetical protein
MYIPTFIDGQYLSARQVNTLTGAVAELYNRSLSLRVPHAREECGTGSERDFYIVHYHNATLAANEYLYYDVDNAGGGTLKIYYKDMTTAIVTLTGAGRQRGAVSLVDKPTAPTHPVDEELVLIRVTNTAANNGFIYEISEIISAPVGYVALNDAAALTENESASVATDLQHLADNVTALELVSVAPNQAMKMGEVSDFPNNGGNTVTVFDGYMIRNDAGTLYYHIALGKDQSNPGAVEAYVYVNGTRIDSTKCLYEGGHNTPPETDPNDETDMAHFDGYADISAVAASPGELMSVQVIASTNIPNSPNYTGNAYVRVYYLGEGL